MIVERKPYIVRVHTQINNIVYNDFEFSVNVESETMACAVAKEAIINRYINAPFTINIIDVTIIGRGILYEVEV